MDLDQDKNIYVRKLKDLVNDYNGVTGGGFYELVDVLSLSPAPRILQIFPRSLL